MSGLKELVAIFEKKSKERYSDLLCYLPGMLKYRDIKKYTEQYSDQQNKG